jgi:hypothetical protein
MLFAARHCLFRLLTASFRALDTLAVAKKCTQARSAARGGRRDCCCEHVFLCMCVLVCVGGRVYVRVTQGEGRMVHHAVALTPSSQLPLPLFAGGRVKITVETICLYLQGVDVRRPQVTSREREHDADAGGV